VIVYVITGITSGCVIALGAIGLTLTYGILRFANLSHGDVVTVFAYLGLACERLLNNIFLAGIGALIGGSLMGLSLERVVWRPLRRKGGSLVAMLIVSVGIAIASRHLLMAIAGPGLYFYQISPKILHLGDVRIGSVQILVVTTSVAAMLFLHYILQKTKLGKAMRATSDEPALAKVSGIDVNRVIDWMWIIGMGLAGLAGFLYGLQTSLRPDMGFYLLLPMFAAVILGGVGNPYGAMLGGLIIGLAQDLSLIVLPSEYKIAVSFVVMIIVLVFRPKGIMGKVT
jgi:neutral amino acid transport system permease protein